MHRCHAINIIVYNEKLADVDLTLQEFKNMRPKLQFAVDKEQNKINFLDISVERMENNLLCSIYRSQQQPIIIHNT